MQSIFIEILVGLFRYLLIYVSGVLVAKGALSQENAFRLLHHPDLHYALGGVALFLCTTIWMIAHKLSTKLAIQTALQMPAGSSEEDLKKVVDTALAGPVAPPKP